MATRKSSSKRNSPTPANPAGTPETPIAVNEESRQDAVAASNGLIAPSPIETMQNCACVLAFVSEFHCRKAVGVSDNIETGLTYIVDYVIDALEKQAAALDSVRASQREASHG